MAYFYENLQKIELDGVAPLVADPANPTFTTWV